MRLTIRNCIILALSLLTFLEVDPVSLVTNGSLLPEANARIGRPATPGSVAGRPIRCGPPHHPADAPSLSNLHSGTPRRLRARNGLRHAGLAMRRDLLSIRRVKIRGRLCGLRASSRSAVTKGYLDCQEKRSTTVPSGRVVRCSPDLPLEGL
jgi:hypothetical protein